ncbi:hypothetical protein Bca101_017739 [Brassica carinata]
MAHRYSRQEKGKWREERLPPKKPLVRIPESDVSELIERNNLTLIGRVTNPHIQKTRALVDFLLQHWNVVGRITGRYQGSNLFQFTFELEKDLQVILSKEPFHFKRWMMILQRIHGIPLHYWNDITINTIGVALGPIVTRDVDKARLRVQINGLKPLITKMDIELPSKEIVEVVLEYEHLEKHCFLCKSLSHEDGDCDVYPPSRRTGDRRQNDIAQQNTLESIEEGRRRQAERKSGRSSGFEENRRRYDERDKHVTGFPSFRRRSSPTKRNLEYGSDDRNSHHRSLPLPDPVRSRNSPSKEASSNSKRTPPRDLAIVERRNSLASRLSDPRSDKASEDQPSAKKRLSVQTTRISSMGVEETTRNPEEVKDRIHVSLRLGRLTSDSDSGDWELETQSDLPLLSKAEGKKKVEKSQSCKRGSRSQDQGVNVKKRRTAKPPTPPKQKLFMDAITAGSRGLSGVSRSTPKQRIPKTIPPMVKKGKDFHPPPILSFLACISWSRQGIGTPLTVQRIREFEKRISPAVLFLMETKHHDEDLFKLFRKYTLSNHFTLPPLGLAGGLSLSWKDDIKVDILFSSPNIIDTLIEVQGSSCFVSFIYGAPVAANRPAFWQNRWNKARIEMTPGLLPEISMTCLITQKSSEDQYCGKVPSFLLGVSSHRWVSGTSSTRAITYLGEEQDTRTSFSRD